MSYGGITEHDVFKMDHNMLVQCVFLVALLLKQSATNLICIACVCMWNACVEKFRTFLKKIFFKFRTNGDFSHDKL